MQPYDIADLRALGHRRAELRAELAEVNSAIDAEILTAHHHGISQADLARATGLTRESVKQKTLPRERRWRRGHQD